MDRGAKSGRKLESRDDDFLKELAIHLYKGNIFTHFEVEQPEMLALVFMTLVFMDSKDIPENVGLIYEFYDQAGPRSINGMPSFFSHRWINEEDFEKVKEYFKTMKKAETVVLQKEGDLFDGGK